MALTLKVTKLPSTALAYTNLAYVNPETYAQLGPRGSGPGAQPPEPVHCHVGRIVLGVMPEPALGRRDVGLSVCHRESAKLQLGDAVHLRAFLRPAPPPRAAALRLQVNTYVKPVEPLEVEREDLEKDLRQSFEGQFFCVGQSLARKLGRETLRLTITHMVLAQHAGEKPRSSEGFEFGEFGEWTRVEFEGARGDRVSVRGVGIGIECGAPQLSVSASFLELGIGGLEKEFREILRRVFASRMLPKGLAGELGVKHVKGLLLYGPPGTGKTLIARQLGLCLHAREPKIVSGPEILNKFVGQSEENVRNLFRDAEEEQQQKGAESGLHLVIFDELDAICRSRSSSTSTSSSVTDSVVNQLLAKIDGIKALDNLLLVGMTNRIDLIDEALLRPGRFEVLVEVGLPDERGRLQILEIHTKELRARNRLDPRVDFRVLAALSRNFSGAELEGLVKSAASFAFQRALGAPGGGPGGGGGAFDAAAVRLLPEDFERAFQEVKPAFGSDEQRLSCCIPHGILDLSSSSSSSGGGSSSRRVQATCLSLGAQVRSSSKTQVVSLLLQGPRGSGKTALAAAAAKLLDFPLTKFVSPESWVGLSEGPRVSLLLKAFQDAYKSRLSLVLLDDLERIVDFTPIGPRFSNLALQALLVLVKKQPPKEGSKLLVMATTSEPEFIRESGIAKAFNVCLDVPPLRGPQEIAAALREHSADRYEFPEEEIQKICQSGVLDSIPIKQLIMVTEMAAEKCKPGSIDAETFISCLSDCGLDNFSQFH